MTANLQEAFEIEISDLDTSELFTVSDIISLVEAKTEGSEVRELDQSLKSWMTFSRSRWTPMTSGCWKAGLKNASCSA